METIGQTARRLASTLASNTPSPRPASSPTTGSQDSETREAIRGYWAEVQHGYEIPVADRKNNGCPFCGGNKVVSDAAATYITHPNFGRFMPCPVCAEPGRQRAYVEGTANLTPAERGRTFATVWASSPERRGALDAARKVAAHRRGWLTLWGEYGSGKSHLATTLVAECVRQIVAARYWQMEALLDHLRDAFNPVKGKQAYSNLFADLVECPVLVIDECHAFNPTEWAEAKFRQLAIERYRRVASHATVWVMNAEPRVGNPNAPRGLDFLFSRIREFPDVLFELAGDVRPLLGERRQGELP